MSRTFRNRDNGLRWLGERFAELGGVLPGSAATRAAVALGDDEIRDELAEQALFDALTTEDCKCRRNGS